MVVPGVTSRSRQSGWPHKGRRQQEGAAPAPALPPSPCGGQAPAHGTGTGQVRHYVQSWWRRSLSQAAVLSIHGSERTTLAPPSVARTRIAAHRPGGIDGSADEPSCRPSGKWPHIAGIVVCPHEEV